MTERFRKIGVVGVGLLGASLGLALKKKGLAKEVWGCDKSASSLRTAKLKGAIDRAGNLEAVCRGSGVVFLALPISFFKYYLEKIARLGVRDCVLTDVGSVKGRWVFEWERVCKPLAYVPAHPMAGSEKQGAAAARADLFEGSTCFLTPTPNTPKLAETKIKFLWMSLGTQVVRMDPLQHDRVVAFLSHLPHALAFALVATCMKGIKKAEEWSYAGNGFRDTSRVAGSNPKIWADIFSANQAEVLTSLKRFKEQIFILEKEIRKGDYAALYRFLDKASKKRRYLHTKFF